MPRSAKSLFKATKPKPKANANQKPLRLVGGRAKPAQKEAKRRGDDFYPTGKPEAIRALLAYDGARIRECGMVWEPAVGNGDLAREIEAFGLPVRGGDIHLRKWPMTCVGSFYDSTEAAAPAIITNPPYSEISARDGHGRWLRHTLALPGWRYCALLLSWDWPAATQNGLGKLLDENPFSYVYLMRWKLDFTGEGSPPQRNAWFVWVRGWDRMPMQMRFMDRVDFRQGDMLA